MIDEHAQGALAEARDWLRTFMADGPRSASTVETEAAAAGLSWATVRRAKTALGIRAQKQGMSGGWMWVLPDLDEGDHGALKELTSETMSIFDDVERLRASSDSAEETTHAAARPQDTS
jgi:hypothetical protein